ncbi:hypothetical protein SELR_23540 [Selenomonas ruminantium subsp. lactilytica TAM6421]|uniref:Glycosyltransferase family 52 n=1 Tax=Selenomonas ruminantium subsp. lactilytica (strain NBRC 103574 / TAM6421) TaxID=927704 RepID=I0GTH5_SELRL|nr:glycosyltransferase family 52 [Selenomonas ruminantium]BAL84062.1 hypothetical protein SELR_23540 [Selenomonas ruminantium subsp. lactilytica TAM6421]
MNSDAFVALRYLRDSDYLKIKYMGLNLSDVLPKDECLIFYGLNYLSQQVFQDIKNYRHVCCFIDASPIREDVDGVPVYTPDNENLKNIISTNCPLRVIVLPTWDIEIIEAELNELFESYILTPIDCLFVARIHLYLLHLNNSALLANGWLDPLLHWNKRERKFTDIVLTHTVYTLFLYMLLKENWDSAYILALGVSKDIAVRINSLLIDNEIFVDKTIMMHKYLNDIISHRVMLIGEYAKRHHIHVYGVDHNSFAHYYFGTRFTQLEDGIFDYREDSCHNYSGVMDDGEPYLAFGHNKYVESIILTGRENVLPSIADKVKLIDIKKLWQRKKTDEQNKILYVFGFPKKKIQDLINRHRDYFLFTQNLTAYGMTEKEQVEAYSKILSNYDLNRIVIKPHPRDEIDYRKYFPSCEVLDVPFPAELLYFLNVPIEKIIGITSTVLHGLFPKEKVNSYPELYRNCI